MSVSSIQAGARALTVEPKVLSSWKEIAAYLGMGVRTVQRYERECGLPIRRLNGKDRFSIRAYPAELDFWLRQRTTRQTPGRGDSNGDYVLLTFKENLIQLRRLLEEHRQLVHRGRTLQDELKALMREADTEERPDADPQPTPNYASRTLVGSPTI